MLLTVPHSRTDTTDLLPRGFLNKGLFTSALDCSCSCPTFPGPSLPSLPTPCPLAAPAEGTSWHLQPCPAAHPLAGPRALGTTGFCLCSELPWPGGLTACFASCHKVCMPHASRGGRAACVHPSPCEDSRPQWCDLRLSPAPNSPFLLLSKASSELVLPPSGGAVGSAIWL